MKARLDKLKTGELAHTLAVPNGQEEDSWCCEAAESGIDVSLLEDSLAKTPWPRYSGPFDRHRAADGHPELAPAWGENGPRFVQSERSME